MEAEKEIEEAAICGAKLRPYCISYACTSVSFVRVKSGDDEIIRRVGAETGLPETMTLAARLRALPPLNIRRQAVASF